MFDRFTDQARQTMSEARKAAEGLFHDYIDTEHILLGLLTLKSGMAAMALEALQTNRSALLAELQKIQMGSAEIPMGNLPFTQKAKRILHYTINEAQHYAHNRVDTGQLLLGILRVEEGLAAQVLINNGLKMREVREAVEGAWREGAYEIVENAARTFPGGGVLHRLVDLFRNPSRSIKFESFSEGSRRVMSHARKEAEAFKQNFIGVEHVLLGLAREEPEIAALALKKCGADYQRLKAILDELIHLGDTPPSMEIMPFTPRAKLVLEYAQVETEQRGSDSVNTEHLLLALILEDEGLAARALAELGISRDQVRSTVHILMEQTKPGT